VSFPKERGRPRGPAPLNENKRGRAQGPAPTILFVAVLLSLGMSAHSQDKNTAAPLANTAEISADKLQVDHEKRSAVFEGNVRASFGTFHVSCVRMSLKYTDSGEVDTLKAEGSVKVTAKDATAESKSAELDSGRGVLILTGSPVITKGPHRLEGSRIEVTLATGRVDVMEARGTFRLRAGVSK
jgi:lipopolysaccharide export system protein LptA